ncbi:leucine--tRNA ligase [Patescibacteria group bacterium]|nr:leucine--tRNA ligase [Patescibacteria group bacterium]
MKEYDHKKIEKKWQNTWEKNKAFQAESFSKKPKYYNLIEFPYPSGAGMHVGHIRSNTAMDIISRKRRMEGYNVLYPIGWDAFGLPTENYAIKTGIHPIKVTKDNTDTFRRQLKSIGFSFDWSREINTTDPKYYKWTQWIFLQLLKKGLAYKAKSYINWCLSCKIGLANEEVVGEKCERCGGDTEKREKEQWMLAITKYADRLDKDLDTVDYLPQIKLGQRNWIGRSEGAEIDFKIICQSKALTEVVKVFTTRPDTIFGATYVVLSPEHELVQRLKSQIKNFAEVEKYIKKAKNKTDIERTSEEKIKTGIELKGVKAINPANKKEISVWIADYVLATYGTGAIMAVPAHDERDFEFAKKYGLEIISVINPMSIGPQLYSSIKKAESDLESMEKLERIKAGKEVYVGNGWLINSEQFSGMDSEKAKKEITKFVGGKEKTTFKLRDWIFSRQRYWGEPIPIIHCVDCGIVPVPEKDLPIELPRVKNYQPTDSGESPLANITKWVNVKCPKCKGPAKRETDTMPNWAGSSWYFLRYVDPKNNKEFASKKNLEYWLVPRDARDDSAKGGIDWYNGGMEHTTLHLLYSRFWHKFLYDLKLVPTSEPYKKRTSHGMILGEGGAKMSKSLGNVINPDDIIKIYGADTLRLYEMFMGPFSQSVAWSEEAIIGPRRFLERVWNLQYKIQKNKKYTEFEIEKTIKKVSSDIEEMKFNTAISTLMIFINEIGKFEFISQIAYEKFLKILSPFAPHLAEELWQILGHQKSISYESWPEYDLSKIQDEEIKIVVQVNGKVRAEMMIQSDDTEELVREKAFTNEVVLKHLAGREAKKVFYVKNRLINIVF